MIPFRDENPTLRTPVATIALITLNVAVWLFVQGGGQPESLARSLCLYGLIPGDLLGGMAGTSVPLGAGLVCQLDGSSGPTSLVTSMFMHGGWFHIIGNMLFLWVFGDNVEDAMGPIRFVAFYLICGLGAAAAQIATDLDSAVPMVGASGAIGGVMGAYALLYPRARVDMLVILIFYVTTISVPAVLVLGYWFLLQVLSGLGTLGTSGGGVAFWAHIGGFVAGAALVHPFARRDLLDAQRALTHRYTARHRWL